MSYTVVGILGFGLAGVHVMGKIKKENKKRIKKTHSKPIRTSTKVINY